MKQERHLEVINEYDDGTTVEEVFELGEEEEAIAYAKAHECDKVAIVVRDDDGYYDDDAEETIW